MKRRIRHGGDLQGGVICRRCNAKAVNLAGEVRCGEIGAVISSAETSEAVKCSAPISVMFNLMISSRKKWLTLCLMEEKLPWDTKGLKDL